MKSLITSTFSVLIIVSTICFAAEDAVVEPFIAGSEPRVKERTKAVQAAKDAFQENADQFRAAGEQFKKAKGQFNQAARSIDIAQAAVADIDGDVFLAAGGDPFHQVGQDMLSIVTGPARAVYRPLIIRASSDDPGVVEDLQEDLSVMSRILTKAASPETGRASEDWAMGIAVTTLGGPRAPQSMYLEGFGALFLASVKFPLAAPPKQDHEVKAEAEKDSNWEEAKRELYGDANVRRNWIFTKTRPKMEYDADRVNDLKESILESLKSAKNIRHLKPEEWITVVVTGGESDAGPMIKRLGEADGYKAQAKARSGKEVTVRSAKINSGDASQLVVRVKKSDVDAFAGGNLTAGDFKKKAQIRTN